MAECQFVPLLVSWHGRGDWIRRYPAELFASTSSYYLFIFFCTAHKHRNIIQNRLLLNMNNFHCISNIWSCCETSRMRRGRCGLSTATIQNKCLLSFKWASIHLRTAGTHLGTINLSGGIWNWTDTYMPLAPISNDVLSAWTHPFRRSEKQSKDGTGQKFCVITETWC